MTAIGGSLESISIRGREFSVAADAEANRKLGGFENEVMANGDGTARKIMTRVPLSIDGVSIVIDDSRGDHEFLQEVADLNDFVTIALTYASGITWQGSATIVGEFQASSQSATAPISLMGPGILTRQ
jgi:hypothetical protein